MFDVHGKVKILFCSVYLRRMKELLGVEIMCNVEGCK